MSTAPPTKHRPHPDVWAGAAVTVGGVGYTAASLAIPAAPSASTILGPSGVPLVIGVGLIVAGAALALGKVRRGRPAPPPGELDSDTKAEEAGGSSGPPPVERRRFWVVTGLLASYVIAFIPLGYLLATAGFLLALTSYLQPPQVRRNVGYAVVFPLLVYAVFNYGLQVDLPVGLLGVG